MELDPIVVSAGTAVVTAMATDGYQGARTAVLRLWRRARPQEVPAIEAELTAVRDEVLAARASGDAAVEEELAADWRRRLRRLVAADPELGTELRRVLDEELAPLLPADDHPPTMRAEASGHGRVYQAGRDQYINE